MFLRRTDHFAQILKNNFLMTGVCLCVGGKVGWGGRV